jgi:hypothetical protein
MLALTGFVALQNIYNKISHSELTINRMSVRGGVSLRNPPSIFSYF